MINYQLSDFKYYLSSTSSSASDAENESWIEILWSSLTQLIWYPKTSDLKLEWRFEKERKPVSIQPCTSALQSN